ncbi:MAG: hypothetical protein ABWY25_06450 [Paenisporosarcina sp.]
MGDEETVRPQDVPEGAVTEENLVKQPDEEAESEDADDQSSEE